jgi:hypothetical protein
MSIQAIQPGGADALFVHDQPIALTPWTVDHNLGKFPDVTVVDSSLNEVETDIQYISLNRVVITMAISLAGKAFFN